jgi:ABC-type dipeptide/oligopeptide/nickel transport system permease component
LAALVVGSLLALVVAVGVGLASGERRRRWLGNGDARARRRLQAIPAILIGAVAVYFGSRRLGDEPIHGLTYWIATLAVPVTIAIAGGVVIQRWARKVLGKPVDEAIAEAGGSVTKLPPSIRNRLIISYLAVFIAAGLVFVVLEGR